MSAIIKGKVPRCCAECEHWQGCFTKPEYRSAESICGWCLYRDAVELPDDHGRLIDADQLISTIESAKIGLNLLESVISSGIIDLLKKANTVVPPKV